MSYKVLCGSSAVSAGETSANMASSTGDKKYISSLTIYPTLSGGDVTILWASGRTSVVSANMKGHTFIAGYGASDESLEDFTIQTNCDAAWTCV